MGKAKRQWWMLWLLPMLMLPSSASANVGAGLSELTIASGLSEPTAIAFLPDGRLLVTEKSGALKRVDGSAITTLANLSVCTDKSMGLLGIAVDPDFASNGFVYLYRTRPSGNEGSSCPTVSGRVNEVVRLRIDGDRASQPAAILTGIRTDNGQHNGGTLRIGEDGRLYVSTGDTGLGDFQPGGGITHPGESTNPFARDLGQLPGKVLRIGLDGSVPADNPFVGVAGARPEVFAYGFRNPFRFGIDPATGSLWLGDVGQNTWEELDVVRAGGNYGWPRCEGTEPAGCGPPDNVSPVFEYRQDVPGSLGASITGGAFAPCSFGAFGGQYFFGDYASDRLFRAEPTASRDGPAGPPQAVGEAADGPVDIVFGPDGALYYVAIKAGEVRRVTAPATSCPTPASEWVTGSHPSPAPAPQKPRFGRICTLARCRSGVRVRTSSVRKLLPTARAVTVCLGARCRRASARADSVEVINERLHGPGPVRVRLVVKDGRGRPLLRAHRSVRLRKHEPNEPECGPTCWHCGLKLDVRGRRLVRGR